MNLTIRSISHEEYETSAKQVWDACFPEDGKAFIDYYFAKRSAPENVLAAFCGNRMVGDLHILKKRVRFFDTVKDIAFIAGVGTVPEFRKHGVAARLLEAVVPFALKNGWSAAMLQPFSFEFYQKFGYEPFAYRQECVFYPQGTRRDLEVHPPEPLQMLEIYRAYTAPYAGTFERSEEDFALLLEEAEICQDLVMAAADSYAWGRIDEDKIVLYELAGQNTQSLLKALAQKYGRPVCFALPADHIWPGNQGKCSPFNMIRVLDKDAFMKGIPAPERFWTLPKYSSACFGFERY